MVPCPGAKLQLGATPVMFCPFAPFAANANLMTSPVRAFDVGGVMSNVETVDAATVTGIAAETDPTVAVIAAVPAVSATRRPSAPTRTTAGAELRQPITSLRLSFALEYDDALITYD